MRTPDRPSTLGLWITILASAGLALAMPLVGCKKAAEAPAAQAAPAEGAAAKPTDSGTKAAEPAADPEIATLCAKAFENMLTIMDKEGTPPDIVTQFRKQTATSIERCTKETATKEGGRKSLDCMLAAKTNADILTCSGTAPPREKDSSTPTP